MDWKEYLAAKSDVGRSVAADYLECRHKDIKPRRGMPRKQLINILNAAERRKQLKEIPARTTMENLVIRRSM